MALAIKGTGLAEALSAVDPYERADAALQVTAVGAAAAEHFGKVLELLQTDASQHVRARAAEAVAATAKGREADASAALQAVLDDADAPLRAAAARGLGALQASAAASRLGSLLSDPAMSVRQAALWALSQVGQHAINQVEAIAMQMRVPLVRADAILALGKLGKAGAAYETEFAEYLEDSDSNVRLAVGHSLRDLSEHMSQGFVEKIGHLLLHESDRYRATAAVAVGSLGAAKAEKYTPVLMKMLRENVTSPVLITPAYGAAVGLGRMGDKGKTLAPYLSGPVPEMRAAACAGLAEMGSQAAPFKDEIARCLEDPDEVVRDAAQRSLERIRQASAKAA